MTPSEKSKVKTSWIKAIHQWAKSKGFKPLPAENTLGKNDTQGFSADFKVGSDTVSLKFVYQAEDSKRVGESLFLPVFASSGMDVKPWTAALTKSRLDLSMNAKQVVYMMGLDRVNTQTKTASLLASVVVAMFDNRGNLTDFRGPMDKARASKVLDMNAYASASTLTLPDFYGEVIGNTLSARTLVLPGDRKMFQDSFEKGKKAAAMLVGRMLTKGYDGINAMRHLEVKVGDEVEVLNHGSLLFKVQFTDSEVKWTSYYRNGQKSGQGIFASFGYDELRMIREKIANADEDTGFMIIGTDPDTGKAEVLVTGLGPEGSPFDMKAAVKAGYEDVRLVPENTRLASFYGNTGYTAQEVWENYVKAVRGNNTQQMLIWYEEAKAKGVDLHSLDTAMMTGARAVPIKVPMKGRRTASSKAPDEKYAALEKVIKDLKSHLDRKGIESRVSRLRSLHQPYEVSFPNMARVRFTLGTDYNEWKVLSPINKVVAVGAWYPMIPLEINALFKGAVEASGMPATFERRAKNLPKDVERYVKEHKEQGNDESYSWALAWSRYCRKNPDSGHCKQDEYFTGKGP